MEVKQEKRNSTLISIPWELEDQYKESNKRMPVKEWCKAALWKQWEEENALNKKGCENECERDKKGFKRVEGAD